MWISEERSQPQAQPQPHSASVQRPQCNCSSQKKGRKQMLRLLAAFCNSSKAAQGCLQQLCHVREPALNLANQTLCRDCTQGPGCWYLAFTWACSGLRNEEPTPSIVYKGVEPLDEERRMTSAQYIINEGFRYHHKRRVAHRRQHIPLFCSHESDGRGPKTHPLSWCLQQPHTTT